MKLKTFIKNFSAFFKQDRIKNFISSYFMKKKTIITYQKLFFIEIVIHLLIIFIYCTDAVYHRVNNSEINTKLVCKYIPKTKLHFCLAYINPNVLDTNY